MATVMKASEFISKLKDVANNRKTLYVMGCFGAPMTAANKKRWIEKEHYDYNNKTARASLINAASADTFGFDCVNLIKSILWGWSGDTKKTYGGAKYKSNGVPDVNADGMIKLCSDVTTNFSDIQPGEAVWCKGHIGVYIGNGLAVECSPAWKNKVQITAVKNIGTKSGYNARQWTKHGKLPYIEYEEHVVVDDNNVEAAHKFDKTLAGKYKVNTAGLHVRAGAGQTKDSLGVLKQNAIVNNYGYYNVAANGAKWLYVKTADGVVGYCSARYLKKC